MTAEKLNMDKETARQILTWNKIDNVCIT